MMRIAVPLALCLLSSSCVAADDDTGDAASISLEHVAETSAALTSKNLDGDPEAAAWLREHVPQWRVYIGGTGRDLHPGTKPWNSFTNVYYEDPRLSDALAPVILVRKGEENDPRKWIQLDLRRHWLEGDRYFDDLIACSTLTVLDLVVIMGELAKFADSYIQPSPVRVLAAATPEALRELRQRSALTCKEQSIPRTPRSGYETPHGPPPPPGWETPDSHTYGPGASGGSRGSEHPAPPDPTSPRPSLSQAPPRPSPPQPASENGVYPGDPPPAPSPFDADYKPRPGEVKETFKCNGAVFYGYKAGCLDLSNASVSMKWSTQIGRWLGSIPNAIQKLRKDFQDKVINNGTHEDCERHFRYMGYGEVALTAVIIPSVCFLATKSLTCANATGTNTLFQIGVGSGAVLLPSVAQTEVAAECVKHICDER
jgi:hypothetical protein